MNGSLARNASLPAFSSQGGFGGPMGGQGGQQQPMQMMLPGSILIKIPPSPSHGQPIFPSTPSGGAERNLFTPGGAGGGGGGASMALRQPNTPLQMIRDNMKSGKLTMMIIYLS